MVILNDIRAKNIIRTVAGSEIKVLLLNIYQMHDFKIDFKLLTDAIEKVNEFVNRTEKGLII